MGLTRTFQFLKKTENEAAVEVLVAALDCPERNVRDQALRALLDRRNPAGHLEVFRRLSSLDADAQAIVQQRPDRMVCVIREAIQTKDPATCETAFRAVVAHRLYDALAALLAILNDQTDPRFGQAAATVLEMADLFYGELCSPQEQARTVDLDTIRRRITSSLEEAVGRFTKHESREVLEAFLLMAKPQNAILRRILQQPQESVHRPLVEILSTSTRGGVIRVLLGFLEDPQLPSAAREAIAGRTDAKFVTNLLRYVDSRPSKAVAETLTRFDGFAWAVAGHETLQKLESHEQDAAVRLLMASTMKRNRVLEVLGYLLTEGKPGGRRAAAEVLAEFKGPEAASLVLRGLEDADPAVQAYLLRQLRPRNIPGAMSLLVRMVDTPHPEVRLALREALPEFTFRHFMANFESIPEESLSTTGHLVRQVDQRAPGQLAEEMRCLSPVRRRKAVLAAMAMGLVRELEPSLIELLGDSDHMVRIAAAKALADCDTLPTWEALRDALLDRSVIVKEVAEQSLMRISQSLDREGEEIEEEVCR